MNADRWLGLIFAVIGCAMTWSAAGIATPFRSLGDPGPGLVPLSLGIAMAGLGALLALRRGSAAPEQAVPEQAAPSSGPDGAGEIVFLPPPQLKVRAALAVALLAYVAAFETLGFSLASFLFLFAAMALFGGWDWRALLRCAIVAAITTYAIGLLLTGLIGVPLPGVLLGFR